MFIAGECGGSRRQHPPDQGMVPCATCCAPSLPQRTSGASRPALCTTFLIGPSLLIIALEAALNDQGSMVALLVRAGASVNEESSTQRTALIAAAAHGKAL